MKAIAREAGVGIGTLYRRFPTREQLIEAVYRTETERIAAVADDLIADGKAAAALLAWFGHFLDYMLTKNGMADALPSILATTEGLRAGSRDRLRDAVACILAAGAEDATLRTDIPADDVLMAVGGIAMISAHEGDPALGRRLIGLLCDALAAGQP
jgi:AcrR family transcriptional regulator